MQIMTETEMHATPMGEEISSDWMKRYELLTDYHKQHGHCRVPRVETGTVSGVHLGNWVSIQKRKYKLGQLNTTQIHLLNNLGFEWVLRQTHPWEYQYEQLKAFKLAHGHCNVPSRYDKNLSLSYWVMNQRALKKREALTPQQEQLLNDLGFEWELRHSNSRIKTEWHHQFDKLVQYKEQYGHCNVPISYSGNPEEGHLGYWVRNQRKAKIANRLSHERIQLLESIGFAWSHHEAWDYQYQRLVAFTERYGHCNPDEEEMPTREDEYLAQWLHQQRLLKRDKRLNAERIEQLTALGVEWHYDKKWMTQYLQVRDFYQQEGHSNVPLNYEGTSGRHLGSWVNHQRRLARRGELSTTKMERLNQLEFKW